MRAVREPLRLSNQTIEALADQVAERVTEQLREHGISAPLVSAAEIARRFGVSRDYVYDHAPELGAVRLGDGPRAPLRFDPETVSIRLLERRGSPSCEARDDKQPRHRHPSSARRVPLLPVREGTDPLRRTHGTGDSRA